MASARDTKARKVKTKEAKVTCEAIVGHYLEIQRLCKRPAQSYVIGGIEVLLCDQHQHLAEQ